MSDVDRDTRDRVIRLETQLETMTGMVTTNTARIAEMHTILVEARGAGKFMRFARDWIPAGMAGAALFLQLPLPR